MDLELIKKLVKIIDSSSITDFSIQEGDLKLRISKRNKIQQVISHSGIQPQHTQVHGITQDNKLPEEAATESKAASQNQNLHEIKSPIVGTLYRAPAPDADPFVQVGDTVSPGMVLCIVEAMKLMNEIECDVSGKIVKILVENGKPVEYNQPLFLIERS